ncbi:pyruvate kinase [Bacillus sp. OV322]|uniref:pyruvate kinase n=1 Tax=Bacillus sp. OV322 TaxID=1882764 RepID=UPI0008ECF976|nr:pyruvate kinase [Bacillus sp. OV322]SFB92555.1 pyruvate kinase [Bacillus sp. OV322]
MADQRVYPAGQRENLKNHLIQLYRGIEGDIAKNCSDYEITLSQKSKINVCAFRSFQKKMDAELENKMIEEGLSTTHNLIPHVLYSLNKMIVNLSGEAYGVETNPAPYVHPADANRSKAQRRLGLFGGTESENSPSIMVTLDRSMLAKPDIFSKLLTGGMNIARINCAHDDVHVWTALIEQLKMAEENIGCKDTCKIYMDLAGPKIRIGELAKEKTDLTITVDRANENSQYGYLVCKSHTLSHNDLSFLLTAANCEDFTYIDENTSIRFKDTRGKNRILTVVHIVNSSCLMVKLNKTASFNEHTKLICNKEQWTLTNFEEVPAAIVLKRDDVLRIYKSDRYLGMPARGNLPASIGISLPKALYNVRLGDNIYMDDGKISGKVIRIEKDFIETKILTPLSEGAKVKAGKGMNLPDSFVYLNVPALTESDITTLAFIHEKADIIGLSFVHRPQDLKKLADYLESLTGRSIGIVAKIETKESIRHLTNIIFEGLDFKHFGIMIARGDLAVELGYSKLARAQQDILDLCRAAHLPVIWATGVLEKMTKKGIPARTELTDVFAGAKADCIMLNKGQYIADSVIFIKKIMAIKNEDIVRRNSRDLFLPL